MNNTHLTPAERHILERLGGRRWSTKRYTAAAVEVAQADWKAVYTAVDFGSSNLLTTDETNPKLHKVGLPTFGLTIHSARMAMDAWAAATGDVRMALADAVGVSTGDVDRALGMTVCPRSTHGCRCGCVTAMSANARLEQTQKSRLGRHLFLMFRPASAFALMARQLDQARYTHGLRGARWRVNISDDLRMELLAPGLFSVAPRPYSYTKWSPAERPGRPGFRLVYSANEAVTDDQVIAWCGEGHRVAVVMDVAMSQPLPGRWNGITVVDGDETDDLWSHPAGVVVGLRAKGTLAERQKMLDYGFTRHAAPSCVASTPVSVQLGRQATSAAPPCGAASVVGQVAKVA
jgi:hypothetical protein